jgi:hypothetical protein
VRRGFIAEKYGVLVDALYGGKHEQFIETQVKFEDGRTGSVSATLKIVDAKPPAAKAPPEKAPMTQKRSATSSSTSRTSACASAA